MTAPGEDGRTAPLWHTLDPDTVVERLVSSRTRGLEPEEAARRLAESGPNEIRVAKRRSPLRIFAAQFRDFMILVLLAAAVVSGLVGDLEDAIAILVIVFLNAVVGATQEIRAERAVAALRRMSQPAASVLRGGVWSHVPAREVVAGDVLRVEAGDVVAADARLLEVADLRIDEAPLTGESSPIQKESSALEDADLVLADRRNLAHSGTLVTGGRGEGIVVASGMTSEIGRIADLLEGARSVRTPLQLRLARFGNVLAVGVLAVCAVIFAAGLARGEPLLLMFLTSVSLAVAAIPEALPAVITASLALGARKMVRRQALVRNLPAVETLGSVTVICSDKTGTLTQNRMFVESLWADGERRDALPSGAPPDSPWHALARALALNNDASRADGASEVSGDPTEVALFEAAEAAGYSIAEFAGSSPRIAEIAFDSERRRMTTLHRVDGNALAIVKGAPEAVIERCTAAFSTQGSTALDRSAVLEVAEEMASEGYRVLAFAHRPLATPPEPVDPDEVEDELTFLGLAAMLDPPRDEALQSIALCRSAGIRPVMITGDHPGTALAIARRLGIAGGDDAPLTGQELKTLAPEELESRAAVTNVYARVSPDQKLDIVRALQQSGEFVAMTGDGVNDAPALKQAEIGVAMGRSGTDVAREAADITLLDDNFATVVSAVREGRRVFDNIRKFVKYTMTSNSGEIWTLFLAPFFGLPIPLLPIQILWINLVTDGLPGLAFSVEPAEPNLMQRPPRPPQESIFAGGMGRHIIGVGLLIAGLTIGAQAWAYHSGSDNWQTIVFTVLTFCQLAHAIAIRSDRESLFSHGLRSNRALLGAVLLTIALQLAVIYWGWLGAFFHTAPLALSELAVCVALPFVVLIAVELEKLIARRRQVSRSIRSVTSGASTQASRPSS